MNEPSLIFTMAVKSPPLPGVLCQSAPPCSGPKQHGGVGHLANASQSRASSNHSSTRSVHLWDSDQLAGRRTAASVSRLGQLPLLTVEDLERHQWSSRTIGRHHQCFWADSKTERGGPFQELSSQLARADIAPK